MMSGYTVTVELRILVRDGKRVLQQRWTRCIPLGDDYHIEEEWRDVPVVEE
jgi:hypothetical protein